MGQSECLCSVLQQQNPTDGVGKEGKDNNNNNNVANVTANYL